MQVNHLAQTKQGRIEYRSVGRGQAVLVLNGGHTNCHSPLGHEAFFLAQGYQLIVPLPLFTSSSLDFLPLPLI